MNRCLKAFIIIIVCLSFFSAYAAESRSIKKIRLEDGSVQPLYEKSYALVIGISKYTSGWPSLPGVKDDVDAVADVLRKKGFIVTVLMDVNKSQFLQGIESFISEKGLSVNNRLLIYFAGHGHTIETSYGSINGYVVPADAPNPNENKSVFIQKSINMKQIEVFAKNAESKHVLFVFDSCFAGTVFNATRALPELIRQKTLMPVRQFITSGTEEQQVPDKSIFRRQFIDGLNGSADMNNDGYITGTELGQFLENKVTQYSNGSQTPRYGKINDPNLDKGDYVFFYKENDSDADVDSNKTNNIIESQKIKEAKKPEQGNKSDNSELEYWNGVKDSNSAELLESYINEYPEGAFVNIARYKLVELSKKITTEQRLVEEPKKKVMQFSSTKVKRNINSNVDNTDNRFEDNLLFKIGRKTISADMKMIFVNNKAENDYIQKKEQIQLIAKRILLKKIGSKGQMSDKMADALLLKVLKQHLNGNVLRAEFKNVHIR